MSRWGLRHNLGIFVCTSLSNFVTASNWTAPVFGLVCSLKLVSALAPSGSAFLIVLHASVGRNGGLSSSAVSLLNKSPLAAFVSSSLSSSRKEGRLA